MVDKILMAVGVAITWIIVMPCLMVGYILPLGVSGIILASAVVSHYTNQQFVLLLSATAGGGAGAYLGIKLTINMYRICRQLMSE